MLPQTPTAVCAHLHFISRELRVFALYRTVSMLPRCFIRFFLCLSIFFSFCGGEEVKIFLSNLIFFKFEDESINQNSKNMT